MGESAGSIQFVTPQKVRIDPRETRTVEISLDGEIPPFPEHEDSKYTKQMRIQCELPAAGRAFVEGYNQFREGMAQQL